MAIYWRGRLTRLLRLLPQVGGVLYRTRPEGRLSHVGCSDHWVGRWDGVNEAGLAIGQSGPPPGEGPAGIARNSGDSGGPRYLPDCTAVLIRVDPEANSRRGRTSLPHLRS